MSCGRIFSLPSGAAPALFCLSCVRKVGLDWGSTLIHSKMPRLLVDGGFDSHLIGFSITSLALCGSSICHCVLRNCRRLWMTVSVVSHEAADLPGCLSVTQSSWIFWYVRGSSCLRSHWSPSIIAPGVGRSNRETNKVGILTDNPSHPLLTNKRTLTL